MTNRKMAMSKRQPDGDSKAGSALQDATASILSASREQLEELYRLIMGEAAPEEGRTENALESEEFDVYFPWNYTKGREGGVSAYSHPTDE